MKAFSGLVLSFVCSSLFAQAQDSLYLKRVFQLGAQTMPYRILFPKNYDATKKYPLVLFLHGAGERGADNELQLVHGSKLFVQEQLRESFPCIVLFPQCPTESFWASMNADRTKTPAERNFDYSAPPTPALALAISLTNKIIVEEGVDKNRIYITGLSMGGMGTFEAVYRYPKLFAAAMPICGGGDVTRYDKRIKAVPFWVFHGNQDVVVDVVYSRRMVDRIKAIGGKAKYSEYAGVNHDSWNNAFAELDFLPWLFAQSRNKKNN